jgi:hypothetical protein
LWLAVELKQAAMNQASQALGRIHEAIVVPEGEARKQAAAADV